MYSRYSYAYAYIHGLTHLHKKEGVSFSTGFGWGYTRLAYERLGGMFEFGIIGSSDNLMTALLEG